MTCSSGLYARYVLEHPFFDVQCSDQANKEHEEKTENYDECHVANCQWHWSPFDAVEEPGPVQNSPARAPVHRPKGPEEQARYKEENCLKSKESKLPKPPKLTANT